MTQHQTDIRRKVRRISRSCANCKTRKIKCDRAKPCCSSCQRFGESCHYAPFSVEESNPSRWSSSTTSATVSSSVSSPVSQPAVVEDDPVLDLIVLPLRFSYEFLPYKFRYFGPTCFKSIMVHVRNMLDLKQAVQHVSKYKLAALEEKRRLGDMPLSLVRGTTMGEDIRRLGTILPPYDEIAHCICDFFAIKSPCTLCFDQPTIMEYLSQCFDRNSGELLPNTEPVKLSIVLLICCMGDSQTDRRKDIAGITERLVLHHFFDLNFLCLQAFMLLWLYRRRYDFDSEACDGLSHLASLFDQITSVAVRMGLHSNIDITYGITSDGFRESLKCMWRLLLYEDCWQSFQLGTPVGVHLCGYLTPNHDDWDHSAKISLLRDITSYLNDDVGKHVRLQAHIHRVRDVLLSRKTLFKGSYVSTVEHEAFCLNILDSLVAIQLHLSKSASRVEAFRYWLASALLLNSLFAQIDSISQPGVSESVYGHHATYFHKVGELFMRMVTLTTLLGFESDRGNNSVAAIDSLLAYDPQDILTLPADVLYPYVGDLNVLIRVTKHAMPKNYGPNWRYHSIELRAALQFVQVVMEKYEVRSGADAVWDDGESPAQVLPDLSFEELSRLLFGATDWSPLSII